MTFQKLASGPRAGRSRLAAYVVLPLVAALSALTGCGSDPVEPEEPEIGSIRLTVGSQTLVITEGGPQGTLTISGASSSVSVAFFDDVGDSMTLDADEFELRLTPANTGVLTFTRTGAFTGTLNRVSAGSTTMTVSAYHKVEQHDDFGPHTVSVTVQ
jgi:hypothetical protein